MTLKLIILFICFLASLLIELYLLPQILLIAYKKKLFDEPNDRKIHHMPIPRLGGISFAPVLALVMGSMAYIHIMIIHEGELIQLHTHAIVQYTTFCMGLLLFYLIGFMDDIIGIGYKRKFIIQIISATLVCLGGLWINNLGGLFGIYEIPAYVGIPLTILAVVYTCNAFNLIDGIDGLATGLAEIALFVFTILTFVYGQYPLSLVCASMMGVLAAFFKYNVFAVRGRKLFMGDAGSLSIGYLLCFIMLQFWQNSTDWNPVGSHLNIMATSCLTIPLLDGVRVFLCRLRKYRNPFLPDKTHIHHKLLRLGLSPHQVLCVLLLLSVFFIIINALLLPINSNLLVLIDFLIYVFFIAAINYGLTARVKRLKKKGA